MLPIIKEEETRPAALSAGGGSHSRVHDLKLQRRPFHEALHRYAAEQGTWDGDGDLWNGCGTFPEQLLFYKRTLHPGVDLSQKRAVGFPPPHV